MSNLKISKPQIADFVYFNGNIYTVDEKFSVATAIATKGQYLIYIGDDEGVKSFIGINTKVIDLEGKTMLPGMNDAHVHLNMFGESKLKLDLYQKSKEEILEDVKKVALEKNPGEWIQNSGGWNNEIWEDTSYPTKEELDEVSPNNPVVLKRMDGHMIWVNSLALQLAGITDDIENPQGGEYLRNKEGRLLGCCSDTANEPILDIIPPTTDDERRKALLAAQEDLFSMGVTSVHDAHTDVEVLNNLKELYKEGSYQLRFSGAIGRRPFENDEKINKYLEQCPEVNLLIIVLTAVQ